MKKHRIILSSVLLVMALGVLTPQFAQDVTNPPKPNMERRSRMMGLVRTINTAEVTDFFKYGSYSSWQTLMARNPEYFNGWLRGFYSPEPNAHFGEMPEILPGWNLRLNVNPDGQGYIVFLEDSTDKEGYAVHSDERGIIWECKWLQ